MKNIISHPSIDNLIVQKLSIHLQRFYENVNNYPAYQNPIYHDDFYLLIDPIVKSMLLKKKKLKILEIGAGKTTYPIYLKNKGYEFNFTAQDINDRNKSYLEKICDNIIIDDIQNIDGQYDLIISTFVFEHICFPRFFLESIDKLLLPHGWHILISPRYDFCIYIPPSIRYHKNTYLLQFYIIFQRLITKITTNQDF